MKLGGEEDDGWFGTNISVMFLATEKTYAFGKKNG
jgi:hypothetical protein